MDGDLTEINVQNASIDSTQGAKQRAQFAVRNLPRHVAQLPVPKAPHEMRCRLWDNFDRLKWEALDLLPFLRNNDWSASSQRGDLPVDMEHLRFKKCCTITSDDRA